MKMICRFSVPKTLFGLNTVGSSVEEMQGSSELCLRISGKDFIFLTLSGVCGSKLLVFEWSCLGDHKQNLNLKFH